MATFEIPGHSRKYIFCQDAKCEAWAYVQLRYAWDWDVLLSFAP